MTDIKKEASSKAAVSLFISLLAMAVTVMLAIILTLAARISDQERVIVVAASALIAGGIVFSLMELYGQGKEETERKRMAEIEAFEARLALERARAERDMVELPLATEPYRHHENHAESPGMDQGQLTSNLPGTTPFFERQPR